MGNKKKRKWTVFFLVKSVDTTVNQLISMMNEIRSLEFTPEVAVVFCVHTIRENLPAILAGNAASLANGNATKSSTTAFITLQPDDPAQEFPNKLEVISIFPDFDLSRPDHISGYFRTEILGKFRAKRYMLFTWDHANAFGMFRQVTEKMKDLEEAEDLASGTDPVEFINKNAITSQSDNLLTMEELAESIQLAFGGEHIDVAVMMNCHMQIIDTGFALRNNVDYLVASEMALDFNGYNYPLIFQMMIDDPGISPRKMSKLIVSSYSKKVFPTVSLGVKSKGYSAISAVDLCYYFNLENLVNKLSDFLIPLVVINKDAINNARSKALVNSSRELVDLYTFLNILAADGQFQGNHLLASLLLSLQDIIIFQTHIGDQFGPGGKSNYRPTGLSIYFPEEVIPQVSEQPISQRTSFFVNTRWKNFLNSF